MRTKSMEDPFFIGIDRDEFVRMISHAVQAAIQENYIKSNNVAEQNELIGRRQAADLLGISLVTLNEYCKKGLIPAYRIGSRVRFKRQEIFNSLQSFKKYSRRD